MKKGPMKAIGKPRRSKPEPSAKAIERLAAAGRSEDWIALHYGIDKNLLRRNFAHALDRGRDGEREIAKNKNGVSLEEYCFLDATVSSFASDWFDPQYGNLLCFGADGKSSAKDVDDAFAGWKARGGHYITTGLSARMDPKKCEAYAEIVARWRRAQELGEG